MVLPKAKRPLPTLRPDDSCLCERPAPFRIGRDPPWYCAKCGALVPDRWLQSPAAYALQARLEAQLVGVTGFDDYVRVLGAPHDEPLSAEILKRTSLRRQASWKFEDLVGVRVTEHEDGTVSHFFSYWEKLPRSVG